ncbi:MAG TPA: DNA-directed RNA polymerase subunit N [archaeon]|jgi:DNA-directed RNA polymerase I, II, and III subunit RPABC5|nr:DNA-directed RNA polymerase subunit N [archaeon]HPV66431.1 DNA-directed RNA polymerase subunit N [archaeon]
MICPVRCFSCGQVVADKYDEYIRLITQEKKTFEEALDILGINKYCCRRMLLTHVEVIDDIMKYN